MTGKVVKGFGLLAMIVGVVGSMAGAGGGFFLLMALGFSAAVVGRFLD